MIVLKEGKKPKTKHCNTKNVQGLSEIFSEYCQMTKNESLRLQILGAQTLIWFSFALTVVDTLNSGNCFCTVVGFFFVETKTKTPANCLFSVWSRHYINGELWKHLTILKAKRICQQRRKELLWTQCLESEASSIVLCVFWRSCLRRSVYLHYSPPSFMAYRTTFRAKSSAASVRAKLTAYLMISMLSTRAQAALWRLFSDARQKAKSIQYFTCLHRDASGMLTKHSTGLVLAQQQESPDKATKLFLHLTSKNDSLIFRRCKDLKVGNDIRKKKVIWALNVARAICLQRWIREKR